MEPIPILHLVPHNGWVLQLARCGTSHALCFRFRKMDISSHFDGGSGPRTPDQSYHSHSVRRCLSTLSGHLSCFARVRVDVSLSPCRLR